MDKQERMAHARAHRGGQTPQHKLTGPEALALQIESSKAQREEEARKKAAAANERETRKATTDESGYYILVRPQRYTGVAPPFEKMSAAKWDAMTPEEHMKYVYMRNTDPLNIKALPTGGGRRRPTNYKGQLNLRNL
mgnify:CR=1 FL=1